jgi:hypothetical protein
MGWRWGSRLTAVLGAVAVLLPGQGSPVGQTGARPAVRPVAVSQFAPAPEVVDPDPNPPIIAPSDPGPPDAVPPDPGPWAADSRPDDVPAPGPRPPAQPCDLEAFFQGALNWTQHGSFGLDRARSVTDRTAPTGRFLRVSYPAGSASPTVARASGAPEGGAQSYLHLRQPADALTVSYWVRFPPGFRFVKGGKLPGLFGGDAGSGGHHKPAGFSTRFMWRTGGAGEVYAYLPNDNGYGASLGRGRWRFVPGRWTRLSQRVVLNTPGRADGAVIVWVDGRQVFSQGGLVLRNSGDVHIDGLFFSTFFGGGDRSWASPSDQFADFAGFGFTAGRGPAGIGPGPGRPLAPGPAPGRAHPPVLPPPPPRSSPPPLRP